MPKSKSELLPIWKLPYKDKLAIAKQFGVRDAEKLSKKELDEKFQRDVYPIYRCYKQAERLGVTISTWDLKHLEDAQKVLNETIAKVLRRIKEDKEVLYRNKRYIVTAVGNSSTYGRYAKEYVLAPYEGGKPIKVDWFDLAVEVYNHKQS